jgi:hypothetical protein
VAFTDISDLFASLHEDGINLLLRELMRQAPALFNHATAGFVASEDGEPARLELCERIETWKGFDPEVTPLVTVQPPFVIPGSVPPLGLDFCFQVSRLRIDFPPGDVIDLPAELGPALADETLALAGRVCLGLACPDPDALRLWSDRIAHDAVLERFRGEREKEPGGPGQPLEPRLLPARGADCFCVDFFALARLEIVPHQLPDPPGGFYRELAIRVAGFELVDLAPEGLEAIVECLIEAMLMTVVLPVVRIPFNAVFLGFDGSPVHLLLAPVLPPAVDANPSLSKDTMQLFVDVVPVAGTGQ